MLRENQLKELLAAWFKNRNNAVALGVQSAALSMAHKAAL